jgi:hypothetical protein
MDADTDSALPPVGPLLLPKPPLDRDSCLDRGWRTFECREELIGASINLVPARSPHRTPNDALNVTPHGRVTIAKVFEKGSGVLDVGEQEGDQAGWEVRDSRRSPLDSA